MGPLSELSVEAEADLEVDLEEDKTESAGDELTPQKVLPSHQVTHGTVRRLGGLSFL